ncbi:hypothetical protein B0H19DRAFT_387697 [Mycena capillaripes]|nr:hypothetical protein B0H19DRAFT_387697 [Mycena capillaripes]
MDMLRKTEGPPFLFFVDDFNNGHGIDPDMMGGASGIDIRRPDLPGQTGEWYGAWAPTLLEKQKRQKPLGERTQVIWNATTNPTWGVEVRLEALKVEENEDLDLDGDEAEDDGGPMKGISGYEVRATVLRVFVKDEEFKRLQEPDEIEENEGEEEYGDESM